MIQHIWSDHQQLMFSQLMQPSATSMLPPGQSPLPQLGGTSSMTSLSEHDSWPSSFPQTGLPTPQLSASDETPVPSPTPLSSSKTELCSSDGAHVCQWRDSSSECGQSFQSAEDLHKHVLSAHTSAAQRDEAGSFSCRWADCSRGHGQGADGFPQKSKLDRHLQTHTQCT